MKKKKYIYILLALLILINLICLRTGSYTNYFDEKKSIKYSITLTDNIWIDVKYLRDSKENYNRYVMKNLRNNLLSQIAISRISSKSHKKCKIKILKCNVKIIDELNRIIPYKTVEIENFEHTKEKNTITYLSEAEYLKSKPEMTEMDLATYTIYYTYPFSDLENIDNPIFKLNLKISVEGKEYILNTQCKLKRKNERKFWVWFLGID